MKIEIPGYRPSIIDNELYLFLDDFRAFRHKFRHSYSFELDWEKEKAIGAKFDKTETLFRKQIMHFLCQLNQI